MPNSIKDGETGKDGNIRFKPIKGCSASVSSAGGKLQRLSFTEEEERNGAQDACGLRICGVFLVFWFSTSLKIVFDG